MEREGWWVIFVSKLADFQGFLSLFKNFLGYLSFPAYLLLHSPSDCHPRLVFCLFFHSPPTLLVLLGILLCWRGFCVRVQYSLSLRYFYIDFQREGGGRKERERERGVE